MKRLLLVFALTAALLGLTAAPALAGPSSATTYHGEFTSAAGMHKTLVGLQSIGASGSLERERGLTDHADHGACLRASLPYGHGPADRELA